MTSADFTIPLLLLSMVQLVIIRRFYLQSKTLRFTFSGFVRDTGVQIDEMTSSAREEILEQFRHRNPGSTDQDAERTIPDVLIDANKTYWNRVGRVQDDLARNSITKISTLDVRFGLSDNFRQS